MKRNFISQNGKSDFSNRDQQDSLTLPIYSLAVPYWVSALDELLIMKTF